MRAAGLMISWRGWVAERSKAPVLKTGRGASPSWVRIPPHPPMYLDNPLVKNIIFSHLRETPPINTPISNAISRHVRGPHRTAPPIVLRLPTGCDSVRSAREGLRTAARSSLRGSDRTRPSDGGPSLIESERLATGRGADAPHLGRPSPAHQARTCASTVLAPRNRPATSAKRRRHRPGGNRQRPLLALTACRRLDEFTLRPAPSTRVQGLDGPTPRSRAGIAVDLTSKSPCLTVGSDEKVVRRASSGEGAPSATTSGPPGDLNHVDGRRWHPVRLIGLDGRRNGKPRTPPPRPHLARDGFNQAAPSVPPIARAGTLIPPAGCVHHSDRGLATRRPGLSGPATRPWP